MYILVHFIQNPYQKHGKTNFYIKPFFLKKKQQTIVPLQT